MATAHPEKSVFLMSKVGWADKPSTALDDDEGAGLFSPAYALFFDVKVGALVEKRLRIFPVLK